MLRKCKSRKWKNRQERNASISSVSIRTDVFYRLIEPICMRESGGQSANGSTACEHLRRAGRPLALRDVMTFLSAAAVSGDQPLAIAAFTFDRKDACRKDAHHATRHYLRFSLLYSALPCLVVPSRLNRRLFTRQHEIGDGETHVNLIKSHFTPRDIRTCVTYARIYVARRNQLG